MQSFGMSEANQTARWRGRTMSRRRALLAFPLLALVPQPGRTAETWDDGARTEMAGVLVPAARARAMAKVRLGNQEAAFLAFAADVPEGERELFAIAAGGRIIAIEVLSWRGNDGSRLFSRLSAVPDGRRVRLERTASAPRGRGVRHEAWTDYLACQPGAAMTDAPARAVLAGTWQAALAEQRAEILSLLAVNLSGIPTSLVAAVPPPHLY
jgi:hypothetical protein